MGRYIRCYKDIAHTIIEPEDRIYWPRSGYYNVYHAGCNYLAANQASYGFIFETEPLRPFNKYALASKYYSQEARSGMWPSVYGPGGDAVRCDLTRFVRALLFFLEHGEWLTFDEAEAGVECKMLPLEAAAKRYRQIVSARTLSHA